MRGQARPTLSEWTQRWERVLTGACLAAGLLASAAVGAEQLRLTDAPSVVRVTPSGHARVRLRLLGPRPETVSVVEADGQRVDAAWSRSAGTALDIGWFPARVPSLVSLELAAGEQVLRIPVRLEEAVTGRTVELSAAEEDETELDELEDAELDAAARNARLLNRPPIDPAHSTAIVGIHLGAPPSEGRVELTPHPEADDRALPPRAPSAPQYDRFGSPRVLEGALGPGEELELDSLGALLAEAELDRSVRRRWREGLSALHLRTGVDLASLERASIASAARVLARTRDRQVSELHRAESLLAVAQQEQRRAARAWDGWQVPGERLLLPDPDLRRLASRPLPERISSRRELRTYLVTLNELEAGARDRIEDLRAGLRRLDREHADRLSSLEQLRA